MSRAFDVRASVSRFDIREGAVLTGQVFEVLDDGFIIEDQAAKKMVFVPKLHMLRHLFDYMAKAGWPNVPIVVSISFVKQIKLGDSRFMWTGEVFLPRLHEAERK